MQCAFHAKVIAASQTAHSDLTRTDFAPRAGRTVTQTVGGCSSGESNSVRVRRHYCRRCTFEFVPEGAFPSACGGACGGRWRGRRATRASRGRRRGRSAARTRGGAGGSGGAPSGSGSGGGGGGCRALGLLLLLLQDADHAEHLGPIDEIEQALQKFVHGPVRLRARDNSLLDHGNSRNRRVVLHSAPHTA